VPLEFVPLVSTVGTGFAFSFLLLFVVRSASRERGDIHRASVTGVLVENENAGADTGPGTGAAADTGAVVLPVVDLPVCSVVPSCRCTSLVVLAVVVLAWGAVVLTVVVLARGVVVLAVCSVLVEVAEDEAGDVRFPFLFPMTGV